MGGQAQGNRRCTFCRSLGPKVGKQLWKPLLKADTKISPNKKQSFTTGRWHFYIMGVCMSVRGKEGWENEPEGDSESHASLSVWLYCPCVVAVRRTGPTTLSDLVSSTTYFYWQLLPSDEVCMWVPHDTDSEPDADARRVEKQASLCAAGWLCDASVPTARSVWAKYVMCFISKETNIM